jgi:hypothetical protein
METPSSNPPQNRGSIAHNSSPAAVYRAQRRDRESAAPDSPDRRHSSSGSLLPNSPARDKKKARAAPFHALCSLCGGECTQKRSISLGARVAIALADRKFAHSLAGSLYGCESCYKAISRARCFLLELESIVIRAPIFATGGASSLRIQNARENINLLNRTFERRREDVDIQLRLVQQSNGWVILEALTGGQLELIKDPNDNKYGIVVLCDNPVDGNTGIVTVRDPIDSRPFKVHYSRLISLPNPGVAAGVAAAPRAAAAKKERLTAQLRDARGLISSLETENSSLDERHNEAVREVRFCFLTFACFNSHFICRL